MFAENGTVFALLFGMKYKTYISVFIFIMFLSGGYSCEPKTQEISSGNKEMDSTVITVIKDSISKEEIKLNSEKTISKDTDYIPPRNGGINKKWYANKNKTLVKDTGCYFGKGLQKRNRYRWGQNNEEKVQNNGSRGTHKRNRGNNKID